MYRITADYEVPKRGNRPAHAYSVNGQRVGTRADDVCKAVEGPHKGLIKAACVYAKSDPDGVVLFSDLGSWSIRRP